MLCSSLLYSGGTTVSKSTFSHVRYAPNAPILFHFIENALGGDAWELGVNKYLSININQWRWQTLRPGHMNDHILWRSQFIPS